MKEPRPLPQQGQVTASAVPPSVIDATLRVWGSLGRRHLVRVAGSSMWPMLHEGDTLLVVHGPTLARCGDILVFRSNDALIAHRVLSVRARGGERAYVTKGDNTDCLDPIVPGQAVIGRALAIKRAGQDISLDTPRARLISFGIARGTLAGLALVRLGRRVKRRLWGNRSSIPLQWAHRAARRCFGGVIRLLSWTMSR